MDNKTRLVLLRGLPGSGKSTIARQLTEKYISRYRKDFYVCEADQFFIAEDGFTYVYDSRYIKAAHDLCFATTQWHVYKRANMVVVANTFSRYWEIAPYVQLADRLPVTVEIYTCRNQWDNIHNVPPQIIDSMNARWEEFGTDIHSVYDIEF